MLVVVNLFAKSWQFLQVCSMWWQHVVTIRYSGKWHSTLTCPFCRYDAEGLPVYTPEELNVGAGGESDKCPFDCDCCY